MLLVRVSGGERDGNYLYDTQVSTIVFIRGVLNKFLDAKCVLVK